MIARYLTLMFTCFMGSILYAADYYPNSTGNFEDLGTFQDGNGNPAHIGTTDNLTYKYSKVTIPGSSTISLNADHTIGSVIFSNCKSTSITFTSGDGGNYNLTINELSIETDFTLIIEDNITLTVNGLTTSNGGQITVKEGGTIQFNTDVTLGGAGADLDIEPNATVDVDGTLTFSNGANILDIYGTLSMTDMIGSGGQQELNIYSGGDVIVRNNSSFSGSADFDIQNNGDFTVENSMTVTGGANGVIDGSLNVIDSLINDRALEGTETVTAGTYDGTGTIFGTGMTALTGGETYQQNVDGTAAEPVGSLPILLGRFEATPRSGKVIIYWQTETELNNDYFTIERSLDGKSFYPIKNIKGAGTTSEPKNYTYEDTDPIQGLSYYRLKQTDYDGQSETFNPASVALLEDDNVKVGPNPATNHVNIVFGQNLGTGKVRVVNMMGAEVYTQNISESTTTIDLSNLPSGKYMVVISAESRMITKKIIKQ